MIEDIPDSFGGEFGGAFRGKRVLVTGHTGFKGPWLCEWLLALGADVTGLALAPTGEARLFDSFNLVKRVRHLTGDIRDFAVVRKAIKESAPDFIFHLAAQSLVRASYREPVETYATNVMGTVHMLEAVRQIGRPCVVIAVTSDKCYENTESGRDYREDDPLGGYDPYSSSKGATELVVAAYARSYFSAVDSPVRLASARAGNVIGGGDGATDRLVPDCIRALQRGKPMLVRNKEATRPWQHVLEPLAGYLLLAAELHQNPALFTPGPVAFNFGPGVGSTRTVRELVEEILLHWPGQWVDGSDPKAPHEAKLLGLDIAKAARVLGWRPVWDFATAIGNTVDWYKRQTGQPVFDAAAVTRGQIAAYVAAARAQGLSWTSSE